MTMAKTAVRIPSAIAQLRPGVAVAGSSSALGGRGRQGGHCGQSAQIHRLGNRRGLLHGSHPVRVSASCWAADWSDWSSFAGAGSTSPPRSASWPSSSAAGPASLPGARLIGGEQSRCPCRIVVGGRRIRGCVEIDQCSPIGHVNSQGSGALVSLGGAGSGAGTSTTTTGGGGGSAG